MLQEEISQFKLRGSSGSSAPSGGMSAPAPASFDNGGSLSINLDDDKY